MKVESNIKSRQNSKHRRMVHVALQMRNNTAEVESIVTLPLLADQDGKIEQVVEEEKLRLERERMLRAHNGEYSNSYEDTTHVSHLRRFLLLVVFMLAAAAVVVE